MLKLLKLFNIKNHKRFNIVHVFQTLKVLAYTSLILTVIRAVAKQYQEHLDEKKMKNIQLCAHRKNVSNLDAMRRSTSTLSEQYFEQVQEEDIEVYTN
jgi:uncharacterized protein YeeX (DUF496 family)